jgi:hypothetical protein
MSLDKFAVNSAVTIRIRGPICLLVIEEILYMSTVGLGWSVYIGVFGNIRSNTLNSSQPYTLGGPGYASILCQTPRIALQIEF